MSLERHHAMKRGTSRLKANKEFKRGRFVKRMGPKAKIRYEGNQEARKHYFLTALIRPCQSCGCDLTFPYSQSHHKQQAGESVSNKVILCQKCHLGWVHDQTHPEHRLAAQHSPANAENGQRIDWKAYGLHEAFAAFWEGIQQPKGVKIPGYACKCQGCREVEIPGSDLKQLNPCILHVDQVRAGIFGETA